MKCLVLLALAIVSAAAEPLVIELARTGEPLRIAIDGSEFEVAKGAARTRVTVAEGSPAQIAGTAAAMAATRPGAHIELVGRLVDRTGAGTQRAVITRQIAVRVPAGTAPETFCAAHGLRLVRRFDWTPDYVLAEAIAADPLAAIRAEQALTAAGQWAEAQVRMPIARQTTPEETADNLKPRQWHLLSGDGIGINILPHWTSLGTIYTGLGQNIAIVDGGLDLAHEDLSGGVRTDIDIDLVDGDLDSSDVFNAADEANGHGTIVAGLLGARRNGTGVVGVAYNAGLVGVRLLSASGLVSTVDIASALAHRAATTSDVIAVSNNSWGYMLDGNKLAAPGAVIEAGLAAGTTSGRLGRGTVFVFAAGNGRVLASTGNPTGPDRSDFDGIVSNRRVIAVSATTPTGEFAPYSQQGVGILIAAPGGGGATDAMVSTDWTDSGGRRGFQTGSYTERIRPTEVPPASVASGTSFAAPLVAGAVANLFQANALLSWRDVPWILALSAQSPAGPSDSRITNKTGRPFDLDFGAGLLNVNQALTMAATWTPLPTELTYTASSTATADTVTFGVPVTKTFSFDATALSGFVVERAVVTVNLTHGRRGDIAFTLTSPVVPGTPPTAGTAAPIGGRSGDTNANLIDWPFTSVWTLGESGSGDWTLTATDTNNNNDSGTLGACTLRLYGYKPYSVPVIARTFPSAIEDNQTTVRIAVEATGEAVSQGGDLLSTLTVHNIPPAAVTRDAAGWPSALLDLSVYNAGDPDLPVTLQSPQVRQANTLALGGGGTSNILQVQIRAAGTDLAPTADPVTNGAVIAGFATTSGVAPFTDPEGDTMRYRISGAPALGTATINIVTGMVTYTPSIYSSGSDTITVEATDGMAVSTSTISYTVARNVAAGLEVRPAGAPSSGGGGGCGAGAGALGMLGLAALLSLRRRRR